MCQKSVFGVLFNTFLTLQAGRPGKTFSRLFEDFGDGGSGDSCVWEIAIVTLGVLPANQTRKETEKHPELQKKNFVLAN